MEAMVARLFNFVVALVAYVCTATMIAAALGIGYLWHTDRINNEKVFRMVAMLHDVDLYQLAEDQRGLEDEVPAGEPSLNELSRQQQLLDRNFEVKMLALQRGRQEYDHRLQQLKSQTDRYDRLAQDFQERLRQEEDQAAQENFARVVRDLEQVRPAIAKDLLMRWIDEGRIDEVIQFMTRMAENNLRKVLREFVTEEELNKLHEIHQRIISGEPHHSQLNQALGELKSLQESGN